ncbi:MAG TPA: NAD(P)H-hydrate dehydratase, partial [Pirellulaceae bacterium]|nr:NAD(P)H-hydrate dehydratase [Pirellulaceae bacterium]
MKVVLPDGLPRLSPRAANSHKGDFGRALLVGGSRGMSGAIALAGRATLRSGAGLVKLAVPDLCLETVAQFDPCFMTVPLDCDEQGRISSVALEQIHELAEPATCVAIGPGLGRSEALTKLVGWLYRILPQPMVLDADALNALAAAPDSLGHPCGPRILTPHPGEFARLQPQATSETQAALAVELAAEHGIVILLKGQPTLITDG